MLNNNNYKSNIVKESFQKVIVSLCKFCHNLKHNFEGNSCKSTNIFRMQKLILRIMINPKKILSCKEMFKKYFFFQFFCVFSILLYLLNNTHLFPKNLEFINKDITSANIFHLNFNNLTK